VTAAYPGEVGGKSEIRNPKSEFFYGATGKMYVGSLVVSSMTVA
jgi:hypothetical protein